MPEKKLITLLEILNYSTGLLNSKGIKDARLNVELMLCNVLKCDRIKLYLDFEKPLTSEEIEHFKSYLKRRLNKEPLQYILGRTNFYGYEISVNRNVLIPRSDTEILVEKTLEDIYLSEKAAVNILEIGTGSGCISVALSKQLTNKNINHKIISIDVSEEAIGLARYNLEYHKIKNNNVELKCEDFFKMDNFPGSVEYIISNPPYISGEEIQKLDDEIKNYEPLLSLTDFEDGFKFYEKLFKLIKESDSTIKVFLEIGYLHFERLSSLLEKYNLQNYVFFKDYNGINRVLKIN